MKRHKWKDIEALNTKAQKCVKCGIERWWRYGDYQCWEYTDYQAQLGANRSTLHRPECEPDRGNTKGFYRDGRYIY